MTVHRKCVKQKNMRYPSRISGCRLLIICPRLNAADIKERVSFMNCSGHLKKTVSFMTSVLMTTVMIFSQTPAAYAAANIETSDYYDPAEHWVDGRSGYTDLNANALVQLTSMYCNTCGQQEVVMSLRTPEYTETGEPTLNSENYFEVSRLSKTELSYLDQYYPGWDNGMIKTAPASWKSPKAGGKFTGYHWTVSKCTHCGNSPVPYLGKVSADEPQAAVDAYAKVTAGSWQHNVCSFGVDRNGTTDTYVTEYEPSDSANHKILETKHCVYCWGTNKTARDGHLENHEFGKERTSADLGNNRFITTRKCEKCGYTETKTGHAEVIAANYTGKADGKEHTVTVTNLSDSSVSASVRYGTSADSLKMDKPPSFSKEGTYPVYYQTVFTCGDAKAVSDTGVAYVTLTGSNSNEDYSDDEPDDPEEHKPEGGNVDKTTVIINIDTESGSESKNKTDSETYPFDGSHFHWNREIYYPVSIGETTHYYGYVSTVAPTCDTKGYDIFRCRCGSTVRVNYTDAKGHDFEARTVKEADCTNEGTEIRICRNCGKSEISHTPALGHDMKDTVVPATCTMSGYTQHKCSRCGDRYLNPTSAKGHNPGPEATCTDPQICKDCGAVLAPAKGHEYKTETVAPTCRTMGYDVHKCSVCGDSYQDNYKDPKGHTKSDWIVDQKPTIWAEGSKHIECTVCHEILDSQEISKLSRDAYTDKDGIAEVGDLNVSVLEKNGHKPIIGAYVVLNSDGTVSVRLPDGHILDADKQTLVIITKDKKPVPDKSVAVSDRNKNYSEEITDEDGSITVPGPKSALDPDRGSGTVEDADNTLTVIVLDKNGRPIKSGRVRGNGDGTVPSVLVNLPAGYILRDENPVTVIVLDKNGRPVKDESVTAKDTENNSARGNTDKDGKVVLPDGSSAENRDGYTVGDYFVILTDVNSGSSVPGAKISYANGRLTVILPASQPLDPKAQTAATVLKAADKTTPVPGLKIAFSDQKDKTADGATNEFGRLTVPHESLPSSGITDKKGDTPELGNETKDGTEIIRNVNVERSDSGEPIEGAEVSINENGKITVVLPDGEKVDRHNPVTVTVTDENGKAVKGEPVVVKDDRNDVFSGKTDAAGKYSTGRDFTAATHIQYMYGYPDGSFGPNKGITRSEATALFARLLSDANRDSYHPAYALSKFKDVAYDSWYSGYLSYLSSYGIVYGYTDGTFKPEEKVSRAEFLAMAVRYNDAASNNKIDVDQVASSIGFSDVPPSYWAYQDINKALTNGWIKGYSDGTFRADSAITRAEAVSVMNNVLNRSADKDYISSNARNIVRFYDVPESNWAYYDIMECTNAHDAEIEDGEESWVRK